MSEGEDYLLFTGKKFYWKTKRNSSHYINKYVWSYAKSGLEADNPFIEKLVKAGRTDVESGNNYTDPKYQHLSKAGPIPEGTYELPLTKTMKYEKSGGGWGVGGWAIYPENQVNRNLGFVEGKFGIDLPWVRSGFFLHEDGGRDGTAGCIGLSKQGIKNMQSYLVRYKNDTGKSKIRIVVDYNAVEK